MTTTTDNFDPAQTDLAQTAATREPGRTPIDISGDRVSFIRLAEIEVRKMVDTRAGRWMLIVMAGLSFIVGGALLIWGPDELGFPDFLNFMSFPLMTLLPIVGIMSATQEWSQRTGLATFTLTPRRGRVLAAKIVASLVLTLIVLAAGALAASLGTLISGGDFTLDGLSLAGLALTGMLFTLQGLAFGAAFLNTPIAIVTSLMLPTLWSVLGMMITRIQDIAPWLDLQQVTGPLTAGVMEGKDWAQLVTASLVWIGIPLTVGSYRILTREVK